MIQGSAAPESTRMFSEAHESGAAVARQLAANDGLVRDLAQRLRKHPPRFIVTCARGSSDHAATFAKYVFETQVGLFTASASPSVISVYAAKQKLDGALYIAISQSGKSPDLVQHAQSANDRAGMDAEMLLHPVVFRREWTRFKQRLGAENVDKERCRGLHVRNGQAYVLNPQHTRQRLEGRPICHRRCPSS